MRRISLCFSLWLKNAAVTRGFCAPQVLWLQSLCCWERSPGSSLEVPFQLNNWEDPMKLQNLLFSLNIFIETFKSYFFFVMVSRILGWHQTHYSQRPWTSDLHVSNVLICDFKRISPFLFLCSAVYHIRGFLCTRHFNNWAMPPGLKLPPFYCFY